MIELELRQFPEGARDPVRVAGLVVEDDGTYRVDDPEGFMPVDLPVLVKTSEGDLTQVTLDQDPATWARRLRTVLRTGYLFPVVVRDDERGAPGGE